MAVSGQPNGEKKSSGGAAVNKIIIVGNIGVAPEWKHQEGQTHFCVFTMAVSRGLRKGSEYETLWYRVTLWGKLAEIAVQYGLKSQQVYVEGRLTVSEWTDREGRKQYSFEVAGSDFQMLGAPTDALFKEAERLEAAAMQQDTSRRA
jgi:single-strand DNA-binding protein